MSMSQLEIPGLMPRMNDTLVTGVLHNILNIACPRLSRNSSSISEKWLTLESYMKSRMCMRTRKSSWKHNKLTTYMWILNWDSYLRFPKLTEEHFKSSPWPDADEVSPLVDDDQPFLILYKELYYRHIYARIQGGPTIEQRFESYYNYCQLFNHILSNYHSLTSYEITLNYIIVYNCVLLGAKSPVVLELPHQWLWEIIDEFVYQFQSFALFRCSLHKKSGMIVR